jgi:hypothetical protein
MSEAVEILIKADDQASRKLADVATNAEKAGAKAGNAFQRMGNRAETTSRFVGTLAAMTGNNEIASFANHLATATDRVGDFAEMAQKGGAGAMAFKLGLVALAASIGAAIGKALGDVIFQTEKFEREMKNAKEAAADLDKQLQKTFANAFANRKEDIELIRDPEEKRAAHQKLFDDLNRDISTASANVEKSKREVEEWAEAWQITGERKAMAVMAQEQLDADKEKLAVLKAQRDEVAKLVSVREQENAAIRAANEAKDKSEDYLENLRLEVEYLKATREEQIKLDASRNTTAEDRGEAERLLEERDAIKAKMDAEKELQRVQQQAQEEQARAAEKLQQDAERARQKEQEDRDRAAAKLQEDAQREIQRVEDIKASERERLELQRIELEQGKEAAKVQELINKGIDETTARQFAAEEAALEKLKQKKADEANQGKQLGTKPSSSDALLTASESRLLTRGTVDRQGEWMQQAAIALQKIQESNTLIATATAGADEKLGFVAENTSNTVQFEAVT